MHPNKRLVPKTVDHDPVQPPDAPHVRNRGVVGYRGFRPSQRERVGKTYSKWLTGSNEGTALSAEEQSAEQQLRACAALLQGAFTSASEPASSSVEDLE